MSSLDAEIREAIAYARSKLLGSDPDPRDEIHVDELTGALLAVLDDHATTPLGWCRRCSTLREEGWPARQGWKAGDCPTVRSIAEKLGIEVNNA